MTHANFIIAIGHIYICSPAVVLVAFGYEINYDALLFLMLEISENTYLGM